MSIMSDKNDWVPVHAEFHKLSQSEQNIAAELYNNMRHSKRYDMVFNHILLAEAINIAHSEITIGQVVLEYEEIIKGEEIWASISTF